MNQSLPHLSPLFAGALLALSGVTLSLSGCVEAENSMTISGPYIADGSSEDDGFVCEWDPGDAESSTTSRIVIDLSLIDSVGHFPFYGITPPFSYPVGSVVAVLGIGNKLSNNAPASSLNANQNDIYLKEISVRWTLDGNTAYSPGADSDASGSGCGGSGIRLSSDFIPTGLAATPVPVELLRGQIPTNSAAIAAGAAPVLESSCLDGALGDADFAEFVVEVQAFGETTGGVNVETPVLDIPVVVCRDCAEKMGLNPNITAATSMCKIAM